MGSSTAYGFAANSVIVGYDQEPSDSNAVPTSSDISNNAKGSRIGSRVEADQVSKLPNPQVGVFV